MKKIIIPVVAIMLSVVCAKASSPEGKVISNQQTNENRDKKELTLMTDSGKPAADIIFDFEKYAVDELPSGWSQYYSGHGGTDWKITD
ncbi:MAG: hypothetical protein J7L46_02900, partial [Bacteroidales bacterium]|nr:hypothetical protein [Bacteroidales bacterium]